MKRLIIQTYIEDNVDRKTINTYKKFPKLERLSRKCFERYAKEHGADYEYYTPETGEAHWIRMEMFNRPAYDEVLYVDCDILIHPRRYGENIFEYAGTAVPRLHFYNHSEYRECNMGVVKWSREECEIMGKHIDDYYHPTHNQAALNNCYWDNVGEFTHLPYKFNVTHKPAEDMVFRHYAGSWKSKEALRQCPIWKYYKS